MAAQSFKERVTQVAIAQAKIYEQVFLKYEYLLCSEAFSDKPYYIISAHADTMTVDGASFVGMHYTEAEAKIREMGFTNIEYRKRITYDSEVIPETIDFVEIDYNLDHRIGEMFNADAEVVLVYWKYEEFKSDYELAFVRRMQNYSIYYMFDTDAKKVAYFYTDDTGVSYASYWGDFSSGITINWTNGQGKEKFTYKGSGSDAILTDANGNTWEYAETDLITAQERLDDRK